MPSPADAAPAWLWVPSLPEPGSMLALAPDDAHYLRRVVRARAGESVRLTDGAGRVAEGRLVDPARVAVSRIDEVPRAHRLTLACGAPEGERADWLVEKLAELGVAELVLLDTERARWNAAPRRSERWQRLAIAALRQSCQAWRLLIRGPVSLADWLPEAGDGPHWLADADGGSAAAIVASAVGTAVVGPAQGLTAAERSTLVAAGFAAVSLGAARLRTETAALALAARWVPAGAGPSS